MALDKSTLNTNILQGIKDAFDAAKTAGESGDYNAWRDTFAVSLASKLSDEIDTFVKSGTVNTNVTIPATSAPGTPSTGTGSGVVV